ncbi:MAG: 4Fe-4S double cluster binding domain-containing protein [Promethearchaeota archaeon]
MSDEKNPVELTKLIKEYVSKLDLDVIGIADTDNKLFTEAPEKYQPKYILEGAKSVIIIGKTMPKGTFKLNFHKLKVVHRLYHSLYKFLDICATRIADLLESLGYYTVPIPSYLPLSYNGVEPWGLISLKHAAVAAGLGKIAKNGLFIHPKYGTLIRLSAIITTAKLTPNPMFEGEICRDCNLCVEKCPANAFDKEGGKFYKLKCSRKVVKHGIPIFHPYDKNFIKNLELIANTTFIEYAIGCIKCLEVCPLNKTPLTKK